MSSSTTIDNHYYHHHRSPPPPPFHFLEITVISAQDLSRSAGSLPIYAVAWAHPSHKVATRLDLSGGPDPAWNDKFVFRVDDSFLLSETSSLTIHILAAHRCLRFLRQDPLLGTVRVIISSLHPSAFSTRFVALQVRRPSSLRPQGILNLAVSLLGSAPNVSALPLFCYDLGAPSAFAYRDLISRPSIPRRPSGNGDLVGDPSADEAVAAMGRSGSVAMGNWVGERERVVLESKLEKWRTDLSPDHEAAEQPQQQAGRLSEGGGDAAWRRRRSRRALSCFCGGEESERIRRRAVEVGGGAMGPPAALC